MKNYLIFISCLFIINFLNLEAKPHLVNHFMNPFNQEMENDSVVENSQTFSEVEVEDLKEQNLDDKVSWRDFPEGKFK